MSEAKNGGPAFPRPSTPRGEAASDVGCNAQPGMSLLAYYAGEAMKGMLSAIGDIAEHQSREAIAAHSFAMAAAMVEEAKRWHA